MIKTDVLHVDCAVHSVRVRRYTFIGVAMLLWILKNVLDVVCVKKRVLPDQ